MAREPSPTPSSSSDIGFGDMMEEPAGFRPATPPPTVQSYVRRHFGPDQGMIGESSVEVGLVSGHPLWGHILYPAAIALSRFLELHSHQLLKDKKGKGKAVIELGAGGGLPGLVAALEGADKVVISDFPDPALVNNIAKNIELNVESHRASGAAESAAIGFTWGSSPSSMFEKIRDENEPNRKFDLILLSDLVFNHSQHGALLDSCEALLAQAPSNSEMNSSTTSSLEWQPTVDLSDPALDTPAVLCFFSHHRPTDALIEADLGILSMAKSKGWNVKRVWKDDGAGPAFPEDEGDLCIRSTVHGYMFTRL
ncbi:Protein N-terminal and lysine N-methyltransferase efm7 [Microbotryomycetes sp. JL221]|nr:Protein N-terminal and lysine N-methyltransferase efm7 [Microbotryomycetes sp. JL221]